MPWVADGRFMTAPPEPEPPEAGLHTAKLLQDAGEAARARSLLAALLHHWPDDPAVLVAHADALLVAGDPVGALCDYDLVGPNGPWSDAAHLGRVRALMVAGLMPEALEIAQDWLAQAEARPAPHPCDSSIWAMRDLAAAALTALGRKSEAATAYSLLSEGLAIAGCDRAASWSVTAAQALARGAPETALDAIGAGLAQLPDDPALIWWRARALARLGRFQQAANDFATLARLGQGDPAALAFAHAGVLRDLGHFSAAKGLLQPWLDAPATAPAARQVLVGIAKQAGDGPELRALLYASVAGGDGRLCRGASVADRLDYLLAGPDPAATHFAKACLQSLLAQCPALASGEVWWLICAAEQHDAPAIARAAMADLAGRSLLPGWIGQEIVLRLGRSAAPADIGLIGTYLLARTPAPERPWLRAEVLRRTEGAAAALAFLRDDAAPLRLADPQMAERLATILAQAGRARLALRLLRLALSRWPDAVNLPDALATAALQAGQAGVGLKALMAFACHPKARPRAFALAKARLLHGMGDAPAALALLDALPDADAPDLLARRLALAIQLGARDRVIQLIALRARLLAADPALRERGPGVLGGRLVQEWQLEDRHAAAPLAPGVIPPTLGPARATVAAFMARAPDAMPAATAAAPVPRSIVQYWHADPPPAEVLAHVQSWQRAPGFDHRLLDRRAAGRFLAEAFGADWADAFHAAPDHAGACDLFRLAWLGLHGGVYADADDRLTGDLEGLVRLADGPGLLLFLEPSGVLGNNFIAARPGHPLIVRAAVAARDALARREPERAWSATGPGLLTRVAAAHIAQPIAGQAQPLGGADLQVLPQAHLAGQVQIHLALVHKGTAGHWANRARRRWPDYRELLVPLARAKAGDPAP